MQRSHLIAELCSACFILFSNTSLFVTILNVRQPTALMLSSQNWRPFPHFFVSAVTIFVILEFFHQYCKTRGVLDVDVIVPHRTASVRSSRGLLVVLSLAIGSSFHQVLAKTSSFASCSIAKFAVSGNELLFLHSS